MKKKKKYKNTKHPNKIEFFKYTPMSHTVPNNADVKTINEV